MISRQPNKSQMPSGLLPEAGLFVQEPPAQIVLVTHADLDKITGAYHAWRNEKPVVAYGDVAGFCKSATTAEIAAHGHVLTPGRYVGAEEVIDEGEPFAEKMPRLVAELQAQVVESAELEKVTRANLVGLGYGW